MFFLHWIQILVPMVRQKKKKKKTAVAVKKCETEDICLFIPVKTSIFLFTSVVCPE